MPIEIKNETIEVLEKEVDSLNTRNTELEIEMDEYDSIFKYKNEFKELEFVDKFRKELPFFDEENWEITFSWYRKSIFIEHKELIRREISWKTIQISIDETYFLRDKIKLQNSIIRNDVDLNEICLSDTWSTEDQKKRYYSEMYKLIYLKAQIELIENFPASDCFNFFYEYCTHPEKYIKEIGIVRKNSSEISSNRRKIEILKDSILKERASIIRIFVSGVKENQYVLFSKKLYEVPQPRYETGFALLIGKQTPKSLFIRYFTINRDTRQVSMNSENKISNEGWIESLLKTYDQLLTFKEFQELVGRTFPIRK